MKDIEPEVRVVCQKLLLLLLFRFIAFAQAVLNADTFLLYEKFLMPIHFFCTSSSLSRDIPIGRAATSSQGPREWFHL